MSVEGSRSPPSASRPSGSARAGSGKRKRHGGRAAGGGVGAIAISTTPPRLLGGDAQDFLERGDALEYLGQARLAQGPHAEVAGDLLDLRSGRALGDLLADLLRHRQHLVDRDPALEPGEGAGLAAAAAR